jgi:hypothetical protein
MTEVMAERALDEWIDHGGMAAMRRTDPLTERQVEVLRWIADGCPDGIVTGHAHKLTARALAGRQLVKISKPNGTWLAVVTDAGSYYLDHGSFPPRNHTARPSRARRLPARTSPDKPQRRDVSADCTPPSATSPARPRKLSPTEQLVADVIAAGGVLKEPRDTRTNGWRQATELVRSANRYGKTPPGKRLVHDIVYEGRHWSGPSFDVFMLKDGPMGTDAPLLAVPVPDQVDRYHAAVSALRKSQRLYMGQEVLTRALRVLHSVATEAERRGFVVTAYMPKAIAGRADPPAPWHLLLSKDGETVPLRIDEETDRVEHVPTPHELKEHERNRWIRIPSHDHVPSGRLRIDIGGRSELERKAFWADRTSWSLEDKLPELLREVAVRADELRMRREAKAYAEAEHQRAVEREEERARTRAAEAYRQKVLEQQLAEWRAAQELRAYAAAVSERIAAAEADDQADNEAVGDAELWLDWIRDLAKRSDPTTRLPTWPKPPQLPSYELRAFMNDVPEPKEMRYQPESY